MEYAGSVIIGIDADSKEFEKKYSTLEKKYANKEIDINITLKELENAEQELNNIDELIEKNHKEQDRLNALLKEENEKHAKNNALITIYKEKYSNIVDSNIKLLDDWNKQNFTVEKLTGKLEKQKNDLAEIKGKIEDIEKKQQQITFDSMNDNIKKISKGLTNLIKKVSRWALAIFGIRGAYMAVRNAMNVLSQEDEKLKADIDYMKTALAYIFEPIVRKIIDWIKLIVFYIAYLIKLWTGRDIFASANKNLQKATGSAKELKNQLAGFDEMNVLGDTEAGGGGSTGVSSDIFEEWQNFKPPKWLETFGKAIKDFGDWIKKNWKKVVNIIVAGFAVLLGIKLALWISQLGGAKEALGGLGNTFKGFFDGLGKGIEAIAILGGFALVIKEIAGLIDVFAQSGLSLNDVIGLMATIIGSLVVLITALTIAANALQSPLAMGGLVLLVAAISAILLVIKETLPTILDAVGKFITEIGPTLNMILETIGTNIEKIIRALGDTLPPIINSVGRLFEKIFNGISQVIRTVGDVIVDIMNTAKSLITTVLDKILDFINRLGPAINNFVDGAIRAVTKLINFMISGIEYMINTLVIGAIRSFINKINDVIPGSEFDLQAPSNVYIPRFYPRLAKGGIINMPGRGVPIGRGVAFGGENGPEGVVPLTDSQQMALLGEAIGRYITINATITNMMNGRVISKELQKINAENDFAYNR